MSLRGYSFGQQTSGGGGCNGGHGRSSERCSHFELGSAWNGLAFRLHGGNGGV